jgi:acid stress-induced BolA-like protein IbaG/YrbA
VQKGSRYLQQEKGSTFIGIGSTKDVMSPQDVQKKIEEKMPGSKAHVQDLTGTADHYQVVVISSLFEGKSMIDQHRMVKSVFDKDIASGEVHALSLKTFTPTEWEKKGGGKNV